MDALWRFLRRPSLAILLALLLLALLIAARVVPQLPGQAAEDPASAMRWLNAEQDSWGAWGGLLRALGLFNVSDSPLFYLLLALLALVCGVHLAAAIVAARLPHHLAAALDARSMRRSMARRWPRPCPCPTLPALSRCANQCRTHPRPPPRS